MLSRARPTAIGVTLSERLRRRVCREFPADDASRDIRYLVIATRNRCRASISSRRHMRRLRSPDHRIKLNVIRDQVILSPDWDPLTITAEVSTFTSVYPPFVYPRHLRR